LNGYQGFVRLFKQKSFVSSKNIREKYNLQKALASNYIIPSFFRGIYYVPSIRERKGHFIENPKDFFYDLFNFVYGRSRWYWSLATAARYYGLEWSAGKVIEIVTPIHSKTINVFARASSLEKKKSHRSKVLSKILFSLDVNYVLIHKGKESFLKEIKLDSEFGPVATKIRMIKDIDLFLSKSRIKPLRRIYKSLLEKQKTNR